MEKKQLKKTILTVCGMLLILSAIAYLIIGVLATLGAGNHVLSADKGAEEMVIILAFGSAIFALIGGSVSIYTAKKETTTELCKVLGVLLILFGAGSLVYQQAAQGVFSVYNLLTFALGVAIFASLEMKVKL